MKTDADLIVFSAKRRRIGPMAVLFIALLTLGLLLLTGVGVGLLNSQWRVREELDKIRAAGEPVTPADLEAFYTLPPGSRDATSLWLAVTEAVSQPDYEADAAAVGLSDGFTFPEPGEPWPEQAAAEQFLTKYAELLSKIHEAVALGGEARFPTRFADGIGMIIGPQQNLRSIVRLLELKGEVEARRGNAHAAAGSIRAQLALGRSLDREPLLISQLLRLAGDGLAFESLERRLQALKLADEDLVAIDQDLAGIDYHAQFQRAVLGERVMGLQVFDNPSVLGTEAPQSFGSGLFRQTDRALYLQVMGQLVAASKAPDSILMKAKVQATLDVLRKLSVSPLAFWRSPLTRSLVPGLEACLEATSRGTARRDVARAAIAAERFRLARGHLPNDLNELVPEFLDPLPLDPFSGAPLRWSATGDDCRIYSVGSDGIDQGGDEGETTTLSGDIVFRLPKSKKTALSPAAE